MTEDLRIKINKLRGAITDTNRKKICRIPSNTSRSMRRATTSSTVLNHSDFNFNNLPIKIQIRLQKIIVRQHPRGLTCKQILKKYREKYKKLKCLKYGYSTKLDMFESMPYIFSCSQVTSSKDFMLHYRSSIKGPNKIVNNRKLVEENVKNEIVFEELSVTPEAAAEAFRKYWDLESHRIPADILTPSDRVQRRFDVAKFKSDDGAFVINVEEIYDPSKFWFTLKNSDCSRMNQELHDFYSTSLISGCYLMDPKFLLEGLYCVTQYKLKFNRAVIVDMLFAQRNKVKVFFIDYGTTEIVCSQSFYFLTKQFAKLPFQCVRGSLANVKPYIAGTPWSYEARVRFQQLCATEIVMTVANVNEENYTLNVHLFNCIEYSTKFIEDVLVDEQLAVYVDKEQASGLIDPEVVPLTDRLHLCPSFNELEAGLSPSISQLNCLIYTQHNSNNDNIASDIYLRQYFHVAVEEKEKIIENTMLIEQNHELALKLYDNDNNDISFNNVVFVGGDKKLRFINHNQKSNQEYCCGGDDVMIWNKFQDINKSVSSFLDSSYNHQKTLTSENASSNDQNGGDNDADKNSLFSSFERTCTLRNNNFITPSRNCVYGDNVSSINIVDDDSVDGASLNKYRKHRYDIDRTVTTSISTRSISSVTDNDGENSHLNLTFNDDISELQNNDNSLFSTFTQNCTLASINGFDNNDAGNSSKQILMVGNNLPEKISSAGSSTGSTSTILQDERTYVDDVASNSSKSLITTTSLEFKMNWCFLSSSHGNDDTDLCNSSRSSLISTFRKNCQISQTTPIQANLAEYNLKVTERFKLLTLNYNDDDNNQNNDDVETATTNKNDWLNYAYNNFNSNPSCFKYRENVVKWINSLNNNVNM